MKRSEVRLKSHLNLLKERALWLNAVVLKQAILLPRGHLIMSGVIFGCHTVGEWIVLTVSSRKRSILNTFRAKSSLTQSRIN